MSSVGIRFEESGTDQLTTDFPKGRHQARTIFMTETLITQFYVHKNENKTKIVL
jgi:hypothetical protein